MIPSSAYFLVFHGSRDRQAESAARELVQSLQVEFQTKNILTQQNYLQKNNLSFEVKKPQNLDSSQLLIEVAALELSPVALHESLTNFALNAVEQGYKKIKVLPLFLAPGVHVMEDIPHEIALAVKNINNQLSIELSPYLGKYLAMTTLLSERFSVMSPETRILVAHGSRLPGVRKFYQNLAAQLDTQLAYWATAPSLEEQIRLQIDLGQRKIAVLPYFLFPGKITQAISTKVSQLQQANPQVELILGQPLGSTSALAKLIWEAV